MLSTDAELHTVGVFTFFLWWLLLFVSIWLIDRGWPLLDVAVWALVSGFLAGFLVKSMGVL